MKLTLPAALLAAGVGLGACQTTPKPAQSDVSPDRMIVVGNTPVAVNRIIGFSCDIAGMEGKFGMSITRGPDDRINGVVSQSVADLLRETYPKCKPGTLVVNIEEEGKKAPVK